MVHRQRDAEQKSTNRSLRRIVARPAREWALVRMDIVAQLLIGSGRAATTIQDLASQRAGLTDLVATRSGSTSIKASPERTATAPDPEKPLPPAASGPSTI
ncbi:hypothetical protein GCM10022236_34450 [Microlunatus ginsengisoli]|uniref:Uncharacterized protein n=1 Tax=Microlunatus ginsengisoli TaxID=363863 RepID=A0ABP7ACW2_9ACTN